MPDDLIAALMTDYVADKLDKTGQKRSSLQRRDAAGRCPRSCMASRAR